MGRAMGTRWGRWILRAFTPVAGMVLLLGGCNILSPDPAVFSESRFYSTYWYTTPGCAGPPVAGSSCGTPDSSLLELCSDGSGYYFDDDIYHRVSYELKRRLVVLELQGERRKLVMSDDGERLVQANGVIWYRRATDPSTCQG